MHGTPWQPLALLALALFGALIIHPIQPFIGTAVASFGFTSIILHYSNKVRQKHIIRQSPSYTAPDSTPNQF